MTGMALVSYMLRVVKDVVNRSPRFRRSLGDVSPISGNKITFNNVQVIVRDVSTDSTRLSFDYFMSTLTGRAILTQVGDRDGKFMEYVEETDATGQTPLAGVYYFNVDAVDEATRSVDLTMESYRWYEGRITNAQGTKIALLPGLDGTLLTVRDTASGEPLLVQAAIGYLYLLQATQGFTIKDAAGNSLLPNTDYWIEVTQSTVILQSTLFGRQQAVIPSQYTTVSLVDQDGYVLRPGIDYAFASATEVQLAQWTMSGQTISVVGTVQLDPTVPANLLAAENILPVTLGSGETIAPGQTYISTQDGNHIQVDPSPEGILTLPAPLPPGGFCNYEVRVLTGQSTLQAKKNAINKNLLPGLRVAIGDQVEVGDQCAILVSPRITETYRVYGSKPGVSFGLEVRANDPTTADELAKMLLQELLYRRRENLESDGLSLFEASASMSQASRDDSGTAPSFATTLSFSGLADWRVFEPLVTRVTSFNVSAVPGFFGTVKPTSRFSCLTATGFIPDYR